MTSGAKTPPERRWARWALRLVLAAAALPAHAFDLDTLMRSMARQPVGTATFTEQRFVRDLDAPVRASGTLQFEAPDKLVRRTLQPRPETLAVEGNTLTLSRGGRTRTVALDSMPEMLGVVESMRATLTGDADRLRKYFRTTLTGSEKAWALDLEPLDARLRAQVAGVRIQGQGSQVRGVEMDFAGGDRAVTAITPASPLAASAAPALPAVPAGTRPAP